MHVLIQVKHGKTKGEDAGLNLPCLLLQPLKIEQMLIEVRMLGGKKSEFIKAPRIDSV